MCKIGAKFNTGQVGVMCLTLWSIKGALDNYDIIPKLFSKKKSWDFHIIRIVGMSNDCMLSFAFYIGLLLKNYEYF